MKRTFYLITLLFTLLSAVYAQPDCLFTHYSSENGLSQNTVMSILQDRKGRIWLSTWDGVNCFDGYSFKAYKAGMGHGVELGHNRVDQMLEDKSGYLWMLTYDNQAYRFNPRSEQFLHVPAVCADGETVPVVAMRTAESSGVVWLLTEHHGALRVMPGSTEDGMPQTRWFSCAMLGNALSQIHDVVSMEGNSSEWLLTSHGLLELPADGSQPMVRFNIPDGAGEKERHDVRAMCRQDDGALYVGGDGGMLWVKKASAAVFTPLSLSTQAQVVSLHGLKDGRLIVVTDTDGIIVLDAGGKESARLSASRLPHAPVLSAYLDHREELWIEQEVAGCVAHLNMQTLQLQTEKMAVEPTGTDRSRPAFHVHEDCYGTVWVHPYGGGFARFDPVTRRLIPFYNELKSADWRFSNKIHAAFSDRQGNLWLCTHSKGLEKVTFRHPQFEMLTPVPYDYESLSNEVRALCEDKEQRVWVGLKDGKLRVYDRHRKALGYLTETGVLAHTGTPLRGNVYCLFTDSRENLWIATKGDGLVKAEPQKNGSFRLTRYLHSPDNPFSLSSNDVYSLYEDATGRLWVATFAGGVNYLTQDKEGREVFVNSKSGLKDYPIEQCSKARFITGDHQGNIWIGTTVGALCVKSDFKRPEEAHFYHYLHRPGDAGSLSNNDVHWITATRNGELYLATFGGGLNKLLSQDKEGHAVFRSFGRSEGVSSDVLLAIREDAKGDLWMTTENGICRFITSDVHAENYGDKDFAMRIRCSEAAACYTSWGELLLGTVNGVLVCCPDSIRKSDYVPSLLLSDLLVANQKIVPGEGSLLSCSLDDTEKLILSHRENVFTLQFAALDYTAPSEVQYAYILEGFEKSWNYVGRQRTATYTNLPKGDYLFKVRSTNADGVWTNNVRQLEIEVLPSFWETPLAYFLYLFFLLAVVVTAVYILFTIYRLKHRVYMEQQLTDMKLRFFTDISHELRTPLTLISGPVAYVLEHTPLPDDAREQLQVVARNTGRMLRLINQILDFRKIQNRKMKMQVQRVEVVSFTRRVMANFYSAAEEHRIEFLFEPEKECIWLWIDADKYEKIVYNLLSNAFKYTPDGKSIKVFIREAEEIVSVGVQDQGIGIAENRRKSIFVRFENLVENNLFGQSSTGIGLFLVKELVEMHKASITVDSKLGAGSCFKVDFRKGYAHYDPSVELMQDDASAGEECDKMQYVANDGEKDSTGGQARTAGETVPVVRSMPSTDEMDNEQAGTNTVADNRKILLLVEDNAELRLFLRTVFADEFRIIEAADGMEGYKKALEVLPDIIISDVMMPQKDGIAMTRELRTDLTTSHIPLILLTAKWSIESRLAGLEYGADDYITKPFSATYLKARVKNLLDGRRKLQELYRHNLMAHPEEDKLDDEQPMPVEEEKTEQPVMSEHDRKFMDKLVALMEKHMDNGELVVDDLVRELAVSRSVFFKKLKTLTGLAPIEFIKEIRINRAVQLMKTGEYSMTQISYMVGINDPRYFSKCFKLKMGMTPTEYRDTVLMKKPHPLPGENRVNKNEGQLR